MPDVREAWWHEGDGCWHPAEHRLGGCGRKDGTWTRLVPEAEIASTRARLAAAEALLRRCQEPLKALIEEYGYQEWIDTYDALAAALEGRS